MYQDLLRIRLEKLYLNNTGAKRNATEEAEYEIYAYMVWNFLETIQDRCARDDELCKTWYPVIETENYLHREWFDHEANQTKFKPSFREFIKLNFKDRWKDKA